MVIVGCPHSGQNLPDLNEITAGTLVDADGKRPPSENELAIARFQGAHVARMAAKLAG